MTRGIVIIAASAILAVKAVAQVPLSGGAYSQNFDNLPSAPGNNQWENNVTLLGWYAASQSQASSQNGYTNIIGNNGSLNTGAIYSYTNASAPSDKTLGSASSGTPANIAYGVRFTNDTGEALTNFSISYTGEQWRNGGNTSTQSLVFSYRIDSAITSSDPANVASWTAVSALNFASPTVGTTGGALDGNESTNRTQISNVLLSGFVLFQGQEIFVRWLDANDAGNDHGLGIDNLVVSFQTNETAVTTAPVITVPPANQIIAAGSSATFNVTATGTLPFTYEWYATNAGLNELVSTAPSLTTNNVPLGASGYQYYVIVANNIGSATSVVATLTVTNVPVIVTNIGYLHTLQDANFALTNTTTLFSATGTVTTAANLVSGTSVYSFHIQDNTGGIDIFHRGGFPVNLPAVGDTVRVTAPLLQFNGFLEFAPTNANPTHELVVLSSGNPLPAPIYFDFSTISPPIMESTYEGRYVVVSNVFLAVTNVSGVIQSGESVFMTNLTGQIFRLFNPAPAIDPQGFAPPAFAASVRGVMTQSDGSSPFDSGYNMYLLLYSDIEAGTPPVGPTPEPLSISVVGSDVVLTWTSSQFNLQASPGVTGTYTNIPGATSPYTYPISGGQRYFRLIYP
jgi:hypothetical protein